MEINFLDGTPPILSKIDGFLGASVIEALAEEATQVVGDRNNWIARSTDNYRINPDGSVNSPQNNASHPGGLVLRKLASSNVFKNTVRATLGVEDIAIIQCGYKIYQCGDYMKLHRDKGRCEYTISFPALGDLGVMGIRPDLVGSSAEDVLLAAKHQDYNLIEEDFVTITDGSLIIFCGSRLPHSRPVFSQDLGVLGTICIAVY